MAIKHIFDIASTFTRRGKSFKATRTFDDCKSKCMKIASNSRSEARSKKINDRRRRFINNSMDKASIAAMDILKYNMKIQADEAAKFATTNINIKTAAPKTTKTNETPKTKTNETTKTKETMINEIDMEIAKIKAILYPWSSVNAPAFKVKKTQHEIFIDEFSHSMMKEFNNLLKEGEFVKKPKHVKLGKHRVSAFFHLDRP